MTKITESCTCGATFEFSGWIVPDGLGDAIIDFRNRHASCRGKVVLRGPMVEGGRRGTVRVRPKNIARSEGDS